MTNFRPQTYLRVWWITAGNALQSAFINRGSNVLFFLGKLLRFSMSLVFLWLLKERNLGIAGYTADQTIVFFLTYQMVDITAQVFYRGVYEFGSLIRSGEFDGLMVRPISVLFRSLTGKPDLNDALFLLPTTVVSLLIVSSLQLSITFSSIVWYFVLLLNSLLIATSLHILVLTFGVVTAEVENLIWTYRDLTRLGQFPITMYLEPLRTILFFVVPVGFMFTVPAQVLINSVPSHSILLSSFIGVGFFILSLRIWRWGLKQYSSASS